MNLKYRFASTFPSGDLRAHVQQLFVIRSGSLVKQFCKITGETQRTRRKIKIISWIAIAFCLLNLIFDL